MDRSTTWRLAPTGGFEFAVFYYAGDSGVAIREGKHLGAPRKIILRVIVSERNILRIVIIPGLLAIGTIRFRVDNKCQVNHPPCLISLAIYLRR